MVSSRDEPTTSEMRHDWLTDRWVIMAPQRTARPIDFLRQPARTLSQGNCPFCHGHENDTPQAVASYFHEPNADSRSSDARWQVRVVPNKFPAVQSEALSHSGVSANYISFELAEELGQASSSLWPGPASQPNENGPSLRAVDLFRRRELSGGHEVIIEGPDHVQSLSQLNPQTAKLVFQAYRDRLHHWLIERELAYAVVFKNVGPEAGASLVHSHSQLIATDILPTDVARAASRMGLFFEREEECVMCRTLLDEMEQRVRIVEETREFIAYCPFASRLPSLVTIAPKEHHSQMELLDDDLLGELSWLVHRLIRRIEHCYPATAYNYVIHTSPRCQQNSMSFHWRIELFPRLSTVAGFEWGSECYINPLTPEIAAKMLRLAGV
jgi:UDPglucose--hexose-1-phosphate uridylyltransferase